MRIGELVSRAIILVKGKKRIKMVILRRRWGIWDFFIVVSEGQVNTKWSYQMKVLFSN